MRCIERRFGVVVHGAQARAVSQKWRRVGQAWCAFKLREFSAVAGVHVRGGVADPKVVGAAAAVTEVSCGRCRCLGWLARGAEQNYVSGGIAPACESGFFIMKKSCAAGLPLQLLQLWRERVAGSCLPR